MKQPTAYLFSIYVILIFFLKLQKLYINLSTFLVSYFLAGIIISLRPLPFSAGNLSIQSFPECTIFSLI